MRELSYNRREFLALTGLALAAPAISTISVAESSAPARCLVYDERDLESFNHFGKPIHITEMGFPSSLASYPGQEKYAFWGGGIGGEAMVWHGEFTETIQANYIESIYTLAYSKPFVEAITYWDFNGIGHDGFIWGNGRPREDYHRLMSLLASWRK